MNTQRRMIFTLIVGLILLPACIGATNDSHPDHSSENYRLSLKEAEQVATAFFDAWMQSDFDAMYTLISVKSQQDTPSDQFVDQYYEVTEAIALNAITIHFVNSHRQGTTAIIEYDTTFDSQILGEFTETGRVMRLVETLVGWRVAWSPMDIFDGLTSGTRLELRHIIPERGNIYDRYGNPLASHQGSAILLFAARQRISDSTECYDVLSRILRRTRNDLETQFGQYLPETVFLVDKIDFETYQREEQILQQACNIETQPWTGRLYHGELAPHLVGYIGQIPREQLPYYQSLGYPQDALVGRAGIEQAF
jgi:penicillin-binding protein